MRPPSICLSGTGLFHSTQYSQDSIHAVYVTGFPSFSWLILRSMYTPPFVFQFILPWTLGLLLPPGYRCLCKQFNSSACVPRRQTAGSCGSSIFIFLRNLLSSIAVMSFYNPNSTQRFQFLHIFANTCSFLVLVFLFWVLVFGVLFLF